MVPLLRAVPPLSPGTGKPSVPADRRASSNRILAGEHNLSNLYLRQGFDKAQNGSSSADLDLITMSAKAEQARDRSEIQDRKQ